MHLTRRHINP